MEPQTIPFDVFWNWIVGHPNCILRAGTPEAVLFDDDDLHWQFESEAMDRYVVHLIRGKHLVGELVVEPESVAYVEASSGETEGEFVFDLISEAEDDRLVAWFFVLTHGYEPEDTHPAVRVH